MLIVYRCILAASLILGFIFQQVEVQAASLDVLPPIHDADVQDPPTTTLPITGPAATSKVSADVQVQARELYNKGVEMFQVGQSQAERGNTSGQRSLLRGAIKQFEQALQKDPMLVEAQSNIAFAYLTLKQNQNAIKAFQKALEIQETHLPTLNGLSTAYALEGKVDDAISTFDKLTTLDPGNAQFFFNKGSVLQKAGRFEDAEKAYEKALYLDPKDQRSLFNLGTLFENQGDLDQAKTYYTRAKNVEIGNQIGLEAIRRLELLQIQAQKRDESSRK